MSSHHHQHHHALQTLTHALAGNPSGLSFLEQTASIYVLDAATSPGNPTTYGWWNFLNDALNELERVENDRSSSSGGNYAAAGSSLFGDLQPHIRLLATITHRISRRPPTSDRQLIGTCLSNASMTQLHLLNNPHMIQSLIGRNEELRERNMGRLAAIVFDYSFHRSVSQQRGQLQRGQYVSAFSDPIAIEQLCATIATNAISTSSQSIHHLLQQWIIPSASTLPPYSVVAILLHVAVESVGNRNSAVGVRGVLEECCDEVLRVLGGLLVEGLRDGEEESSGGDGMDDGEEDSGMIEGGGGGSIGGDSRSQRIAALALKAIEAWCKAVNVGAVQLRNIFSSTNINILEAIADALYSNSEAVIDAVSDLIDEILQRDTKHAHVSLGLSIASSVICNVALPGTTGDLAQQLPLANQVSGANTKARLSILTELISAVGLQRFRFSERQANGDTVVCRCLARTASRVLLESQEVIANHTLQVSLEGLFDLLFKATSHPSIYVCGIALESLSVVASSNSQLSMRLLPLLQGKAIIPFHVITGKDGFLEDYTAFRERVLSDALIACYAGCGTFYLDSCASAIEEFCQILPNTNPSEHLPYQLEAALFCMVAVADKYASYFPQCETKEVFQAASQLAFTSFNTSIVEYTQHAALEPSGCPSPLSEASNALHKLLQSSPAHFSAPTAMSALQHAWTMPYECKQVAIEDRVTLCSGLCCVIASLPPAQWEPSLAAFAQPILTCIDVITKQSDISPSVLTRLSNEVRLLGAIIVTDSLGSLLVDSLALCPTEDDIPLLTELSNLGKTSLAPNTVTMLSFVRRLVEIHGERAELKPNATSGEAAVQGIVKELIILAYDAVETKTQQQDIVSPMFDTLSTCAEKCPILLLSLSREGQQVGGLIRSSVDAAPGILKGSEVDDSLSAINFLRALMISMITLSLDALGDEQKQALVSVIQGIHTVARTEVVFSSVMAICGVSPPETLAPLSDLLQTILISSQWTDVEPSLSGVVNCNQFKLGPDAKTVILEAFKQCTTVDHTSSTVGGMITDIWKMHQTDDTGAVAGGQAVLDFVTRYRAKRE
ncbi:predicted protein [Thalassiosira pseudonana CCMP1335]|uniref:Exportin-1/Importin-beta-like domain-containing protein n=1 Tax=Thalassiosira pseudonana TaxID=35128 RepID=B5YP59_THAPS|nr:predicted protein [Thalassiosira pseudonana CCMP1335]ACI64744.1 predicted protein [Thalassiosira pseudonana CCMP1335]